MKKTLYRTAGLIVALAVVFAAGQLWAASKEKKQPPRTRIAVFNLTYLIKNYDKYKNFQEELKELSGPYMKRDAKFRSQMERLRTQYESTKKDQSTVVRAKADNLEAKAREIKHQLEDNNAKAKHILGKKSDDKMKEMYSDIYDLVRRYAKRHDLDLVMHYNDAVTSEDYMSAPNIGRKLNSGALMPMYVQPEMDITKNLVKILNERMREE